MPEPVLSQWQGGEFHRAATFDRNSINIEARTVALSFSSENPAPQVYRMGGKPTEVIEVLDHAPKSVRLDVLRAHGPVLVNHNPNDQVGVVDDVSVTTEKMGRAVVRFGKSARAEEIFQDVISGIRRSISIGYRVYEIIEEGIANGIKKIRAVAWEPFEISIVPVPADVSVGIGRSYANETVNNIVMKPLLNHTATEGGGAAPTVTAPAPQVQVTDVKDIRAQEIKRCKDIRGIATETGRSMSEAGRTALLESAEEAIRGEVSAQEFSRTALSAVCKDRADNPADMTIGMSEKETRQWSLLRIARCVVANKPVDGLEGEASRAVAKKLGRDPEGVFMPDEVQRRSILPLGKDFETHYRILSTLTGAAGGHLVPTVHLAGNFIELLRNKMVSTQLGAFFLTGIVGNIAVPKQNGGATAEWLAEGAEGSESQASFGQLPLTPHRLQACTSITKTLMGQSSPAAEGLVMNDLARVLAIEKDRAVIAGSGAGAIPTGILTSADAATVTFAAPATPTWAELVAFETAVANENADVGSLAYLVSAVARGKLKTTPKVTNQAFFIWEADPQGRPGFGIINGYPAFASKQITEATNVLFGNWGDVVVCDFVGQDVVINPYSGDKSNTVRITINTHSDVGLRHTKSFSKSTNGIT